MVLNALPEKSLLEKIHDLLERKPGHCDVTFCVGKEKKIVGALMVILKASSPFLEKIFEEKWELAEIKEGEGIPLPDIDPIAFELFVKITSLDTWSLEILKPLNLPPNQILNLLFICQRFEMEIAVGILEELATTFMRSFSEYKGTDDFLQLSQTNLKYVLVRDDIGISELEAFRCAIRWADFQCKEMKVEPTVEHIRKVLGDCLFEIRFPIMSFPDFSEMIDSRDILTVEETVGIYRFIGLAASKKLEIDTVRLPFKTTPRKTTQALESKAYPNINNNEALITPGCSTLSLTRDIKIVENPPFICDGSAKGHHIACEKKITIFGLGFLGPIENDGFYDVNVQLQGYGGIKYDSKLLEKRIFAQKDKIFYFVFDTPIDFEAGSVSDWTTNYGIYYCLHGPNTSAVVRSSGTDSVLQEGDTKFRLGWESDQLAEILFKLR